MAAGVPDSGADAPLPLRDLLERLRDGISTGSPEETEALGADLAQAIPANAVIALSGDLGAGKTALCRGIARGLGIDDAITSPTFNLYAVYYGDRQLIHIDAYRLETSSDMDGLLIDDLLDPPFLMVVEWPERIAGWEWLADALHIRLAGTGTHRSARIIALS